jgi:hypothetical protein
MIIFMKSNKNKYDDFFKLTKKYWIYSVTEIQWNDYLKFNKEYDDFLSSCVNIPFNKHDVILMYLIKPRFNGFVGITKCIENHKDTVVLEERIFRDVIFNEYVLEIYPMIVFKKFIKTYDVLNFIDKKYGFKDTAHFKIKYTSKKTPILCINNNGKVLAQKILEINNFMSNDNSYDSSSELSNDNLCVLSDNDTNNNVSPYIPPNNNKNNNVSPYIPPNNNKNNNNKNNNNKNNNNKNNNNKNNNNKNNNNKNNNNKNNNNKNNNNKNNNNNNKNKNNYDNNKNKNNYDNIDDDNTDDNDNIDDDIIDDDNIDDNIEDEDEDEYEDDIDENNNNDNNNDNINKNNNEDEDEDEYASDSVQDIEGGCIPIYIEKCAKYKWKSENINSNSNKKYFVEHYKTCTLCEKVDNNNIDVMGYLTENNVEILNITDELDDMYLETEKYHIYDKKYKPDDFELTPYYRVLDININKKSCLYQKCLFIAWAV